MRRIAGKSCKKPHGRIIFLCNIGTKLCLFVVKIQQKTVDKRAKPQYNIHLDSNKKEFEMATATYNALTEKEKREVRMYGVTEAGMRESVESSLTFKLSGPAMIVASMMSDAQEIMAYEQPDFNTIEDQRQLLNRAKFVLFEYVMKAGE